MGLSHETTEQSKYLQAFKFTIEAVCTLISLLTSI